MAMRAMVDSGERFPRLRVASDSAGIPHGGLGDTYDTALAATINGLYTAEVLRRREPWRSFEAVDNATHAWVACRDTRRRLEPIGNIPLAETEANLCAVLKTDAVAA